MRRIFEIGRFRLDAEAGMLTLDGTPARLGPRAVALLATLVENANRYVPKHKLLDLAWPGIVVEESNLPVQMWAIRRVLAQGGGDHWIETLPKRGYRFTGPALVLSDRRAPAVRSVGGRTNLSAPLTSFIGREREIVELKRLLPGKRLLTITGIGGVGKTRLACEMAAEVLDAYRDGVWLVELGSLRDPALVPAMVAQVLGVHERSGTLVKEALCNHLKFLQVMLILDNCEHVLEPCAALVEALLGRARDTTIVATSREPLRLNGEQLFPLQPLSLPDPASRPDAVLGSEAVRLFVERLQQQLPGFEPAGDQLSTAANICIRLDGIPLALEFAAARARSLSLEQIGARLDERFKLLTGGSRTAVPRQQTLRATLDWSYGLLRNDERVVLHRLAIFPASFTVEAAVAVARDATLGRDTVVDLLQELVARSLIEADIEAGVARYRLLETTREYAMEKLAETGEVDATRRSHARFVCDLFERAANDWLSVRQAEWRARYAPELPNVRAALDWGLESPGDRQMAMALAGASGVLWTTLGLYGEGVRRLESTIARIDTATAPPIVARLWYWLGRLLDEQPARARVPLERAVEIYGGLDEPTGLGLSLMTLGRVLALMGEFDASRAALVRARPLLANIGGKALGFYHFNVAFLGNVAGDLADARAHYERALQLFRETGEVTSELSAVGNLANVAWGLGELKAAEDALRDLLALLRSSPERTRRQLGFCLMNLAGVLTEEGRPDEALTLAREGFPLVAQDGSAWLFVDHLALRAALAGDLTTAARLAGHADAAHAINRGTRQFIEARTRERLHAILRDNLPNDELERLLQEGAGWSEDEASRHALGD